MPGNAKGNLRVFGSPARVSQWSVFHRNRRKAMNPMKAHPMSMDRMIFEMKASVLATSLYMLLCSHLDEGQKPTLNLARRVWNSTEEDLAEAARELIGLNVLKPIDPLEFDLPISINPREKWIWTQHPHGGNGLVKQ
jgi:hypothetical protein